MEKFNKIEYDCPIPDTCINRGRFARSEEYMKIKDFLNSKHETMRFVYDTPEDARKRRQSLDVTIKREGIPVKTHLFKNELYIGKQERKMMKPQLREQPGNQGN